MKTLLTFCLLLFSQTIFAQTQIDEYGAMITDDEFGHLADFSEQLNKNNAAVGTIIIYKDKLETTGKFLRHFYGVKDFLVKSFGLSPDRFSVVFGGENERHTEIWLSKTKDETVKFENKVLDETLNGKIVKKMLFDENYLDGDESPFINQFIFREGLDHLAEALKANPKTYVLAEISSVEGLSKTRKERAVLSGDIFGNLVEKHKIPKNKIVIRFKKSKMADGFAYFYIIPETAKINRK